MTQPELNRSAGFSPHEHSQEAGNMRAEARTPITMLVGLLVVTALVFAPTLRHDFIAWDDQFEIYHNPDFNPVTVQSLAWNWTHTRLTVWMPLTYYVWGAIAVVARQAPDARGIALNAAPFHAACLLFHLLSVAFAFFIIRTLIGRNYHPEPYSAKDLANALEARSFGVPQDDKYRNRAAIIGAAIFALHALQVEPVAWASGMYTVLSGALSLAAIHQYIRGIDSQTRRGQIVHLVIATGLFILGLLTKPSTIVLPLIVIALHVLLLRKSWRVMGIVGAIWIVLSAAAFVYARQFHAAEDVPSLLIKQRVIVAGDALAFYLSKVALPIHLLPDYGRWPSAVVANPGMVWVLPLMALVAMVALTNRIPRLVAASMVFLLALAPYMGLVKFDYQFYSTVCDRYAYLAMFGVALLIAALLDRYRHRALLALGVACAIACAALSSMQLRHWRDTQTLFEYTLRIRPDSLVANKVLGSEFTATNPARAAKHFEAAIAARPDDPVVHYNYGNLLLDQKNLPAAIEQWQEAVAARPRYFLAWNNLGIAAWRDRDFDRAGECFKRAIEGSEASGTPSAEAYQNLGLLEAAQGDSAASNHLERALSINPDLPRARNALAAIRKNSR